MNFIRTSRAASDIDIITYINVDNIAFIHEADNSTCIAMINDNKIMFNGKVSAALAKAITAATDGKIINGDIK